MTLMSEIGFWTWGQTSKILVFVYIIMAVMLAYVTIDDWVLNYVKEEDKDS